MNIAPEILNIAPQVAEAIKSNRPVIAYESAVITHGLPHPTNLELAVEVENIARNMEVTPATIALMDGQIKVGLNPDELTRLAESDDSHKISGKDLAIALQRGWSGGTTVAASIIIARLAGIKVFATGGIGGVHRNSQFDVSNDLFELGRQPLIVVCSGAKSILDIGATLEVLETFGVAIYGYKTEIFPQFYTQGDEAHKVNRIESAAELAQIYFKHQELKSTSAMLVANPLMPEQLIDQKTLESLIMQTLVQANERGITGAAITPFMLTNLAELSNGNTLKANLQLLQNNARLGCEISSELVKGSRRPQFSV